MCQIHPRYLSILIVIVDSMFTARQQSLGQGNAFTPVCHSVHGVGGGFQACITGHMTSIQGRSASRWVCKEGVCLQGGLGRHPSLFPPPELRKRAVRILLECFLVQ